MPTRVAQAGALAAAAGAVVEELTVSATATPLRTVRTFPDMVLRCNGPGVIYDPAIGSQPPCGRNWDHTSEVEPMSVQVQIEYQVTRTSSIDNSGTTTWTADPLGTFDLFVGEIQSLGTRSDNPPPWDPGFETRPAEQLPDCTLIMIVEGDCATGVAALDEDVKRCIDGRSIGDFLRDPPHIMSLYNVVHCC